MDPALMTEVSYLKGVGPQRAELLNERGIRTVEDLPANLQFPYEARIRFSNIRELEPDKTYTVLATVASGGAVRYARGGNAIYHLLVQDATGSLHCKFFHGGYLESRLKPGQELVLHGKAEIDRLRPARIEMVNPQIELLGKDGADSTEGGRIVPIYEAIGTFGSRAIPPASYQALGGLDEKLFDPLPQEMLSRLGFPPRREAILYAHFPPATEDVEALNSFRSPAHQRLIFEEFFFYQLSLALGRRATRSEKGIAFRVREDRIREALKRILPFKPTGAQKRVLAEIAADMEKPAPMNRLLQGDVGSGKTIVAAISARDRKSTRLN